MCLLDRSKWGWKSRHGLRCCLALMFAVALVAAAHGQMTVAPALSAESAVDGVLSQQSGSTQAGAALAKDPFLGSVTAAKATPGVVDISLDEAIAMGLDHNLGLVLQQQTQRATEAETLVAFNALLPEVSAQAQTSVEQIDLVALGFKPALIASFGPNLHFSPIVKVNYTSAQVNLSQTLFNLSAFELYRTAKEDVRGAALDTLNARGAVILGAGDAYLQALADEAQVANAKALLSSDELLMRQARDKDQAGVATHLDALRAQVQFQAQEETLIQAQVALEKDKIALKRRIGIDPAQKIRLTDPAPFAELAALPLEQAKSIAYGRRKDYLSVLSQIRAMQSERKAVRYQHLPTLSFNGNYGVTGETTGLYHGTFFAAGNLDFPIFQEAKLRGEREVVDAQLNGLMQRAADLRVAIDGQIRSSMLDVHAADQLVGVARSQVDLAKEEVDQATERFQAGVDDDLRVVQAQAALADAQSSLVNSLRQYNEAKLALARDTGVVETQYKDYLGR